MVQTEVDFVRPHGNYVKQFHIAYRFFPLIEMGLYALYRMVSTFRTALL